MSVDAVRVCAAEQDFRASGAETEAFRKRQGCFVVCLIM